jgi:flagellar biosynthesis activator protein FlaF
VYQLNYAEIQQDSVADAKERERALLQRSIDLLNRAKSEGRGSFSTIEAVHFVSRIWTSFLEDLASEQNGLPKELRASLISIGLWILREAEAIRLDESDNIDGLIEISQIIRTSLA